MPFRSRVASFFRSLFGQSRLDRELDEELQGYLEELVARKVGEGSAPDRARREALVEIGGVEQVKEKVREVRVGSSFAEVLHDFRYGWRSLRRSPGYLIGVTITLALCLGANVALFSVVRSVLWRPLPYPEAHRIVVIETDVGGVANAGISPGEVLDLRLQSKLVERLATVAGVEAHVDVDGEVERVAAASVTDDLLPLLGATPPALGRSLIAEEDVAGRVRSVVISHRLWRQRFGASTGAVGRRVRINNSDMQIVGVLRPEFRVFLPPSSNAPEEIDVWFPTTLENTRRYRGFFAVARLAPGVPLERAQAEFDTLASRFVDDHPESYPNAALRFSVVQLQDALTRPIRPALTALAVAVGFVLLIGWVNVANLTLARTAARERELAVRRALGAGRVRLGRQLLAEGLILGTAAGAAGLLVGRLGLEFVSWLRPVHLPLQSQISIDPAVAIFAVALSLVTASTFGLAPAIRFASEHELRPLKASRSDASASGPGGLRRSLVVAEVALSIIPLVAAGTMLRSFVNLVDAPLGFDPSKILTARAPISLRMFPDLERRGAYYQQVLERVRQLPGVSGVSAASPLPLAPMQVTKRYGREQDPESPMSLATQQTVMPGYLRLTGTTLLEGRDFTAEDFEAQRSVVIIDERIARQLWPLGAIGKRMAIEPGRRFRVLEVIGVTSAVRVTRVRDEETPHFFVPYHLNPVEMSLVVNTGESAAALGPLIEQSVESLGSGRAVFDTRPMGDYVSDSIGDTRFALLVLGGFAGASLLLAGVGLYGTLTYLISQRRRELGLRMALGASIGRVVGMVLRESAALTLAGAAIGLAGAFGTTRAIRGMLYNVTPFDGLTVLAVAATVVLTAVVAAIGPAWSAARVDPNVALRED